MNRLNSNKYELIRGKVNDCFALKNNRISYKKLEFN